MVKAEVCIPKLRFVGFADEWQINQLGDICSHFQSGKGITTNDIYENAEYPVYGGNGLRGYAHSFTHEGLFTLIGRQGALCGNINLVSGKNYISEHAIAVQADFNNDTQWLSYLLDLMNLGALSESSAQPGLAVNKLVRLKINFPSKIEQTQIGSFFQKIDHVIELQQKALASAQDYKKAMLQKMFPQQGEKIPQIRFAGFSGDWEENNLKGITKINPSSNLPEEFYYIDLESVKGSRLIGCRTESKDTAPSRAQRLAIHGDIFYQTVRPYQKNNYLFNFIEDNYVFSTGYAQLRPLKYNDSAFIFAQIQNEKFVNDVLERCTGTSYPSINSTDLSLINIYVPKIEEQQKIGAFFQKLDTQIEQHEKKLAIYQNLKKAMLQRMFV